MPSLLDVLALLRNQAQTRNDLGGGKDFRPYTMAGRVFDANQPAPSSLAQALQRPPTESPDAEGLGGLTALAMGAKVFKPQPATMEEYIRSLARGETGLGGRGRLYPVLLDKSTGEKYIGQLGGNHPWDQYEAAMKVRGGQAGVGNLEAGFSPHPDAPVFNPELAQHLAFPEGTKQVAGLLDKGLPIDSIIEALKFGKQLGR